MKILVAFSFGVLSAAIALFLYQKVNGATGSWSGAQAAACVKANMTWEPAFDRYGVFVGIRCNPDVPYARHDGKRPNT